MGSASSLCLRLPRWDRLIVPLPGARNIVAVGAPWPFAASPAFGTELHPELAGGLRQARRCARVALAALNFLGPQRSRRGSGAAERDQGDRPGVEHLIRLAFGVGLLARPSRVSRLLRMKSSHSLRARLPRRRRASFRSPVLFAIGVESKFVVAATPLAMVLVWQVFQLVAARFATPLHRQLVHARLFGQPTRDGGISIRLSAFGGSAERFHRERRSPLRRNSAVAASIVRARHSPPVSADFTSNSPRVPGARRNTKPSPSSTLPASRTDRAALRFRPLTSSGSVLRSFRRTHQRLTHHYSAAVGIATMGLLERSL